MGDGEVSSGQLESPCLIRDRLEFFKVESLGRGRDYGVESRLSVDLAVTPFGVGGCSREGVGSGCLGEPAFYLGRSRLRVVLEHEGDHAGYHRGGHAGAGKDHVFLILKDLLGRTFFRAALRRHLADDRHSGRAEVGFGGVDSGIKIEVSGWPDGAERGQIVEGGPDLRADTAERIDETGAGRKGSHGDGSGGRAGSDQCARFGRQVGEKDAFGSLLDVEVAVGGATVVVGETKAKEELFVLGTRKGEKEALANLPGEE